jgi:hypothetical protein
MAASGYGHTAVVELLLKVGADPSIKDKDVFLVFFASPLLQFFLAYSVLLFVRGKQLMIKQRKRR